MEILIEKPELFLNQVRTRLPFKFGIATLVEAPQVFVRVHLRQGDKRASGVASELLPPRWFTKDPNKSRQQEIDEWIKVIRKACESSTDSHGSSLFDWWLKLYWAQKSWGDSEGLPSLLSNFGVTLVERAAIEAFCKLNELTFHEALLKNAFKIDLAEIHSQLPGEPQDYLPRRPLTSIYCRHTYGLGDPIYDSELSERPPDNLPCSLEGSIDRYQLKHFKIKINGNVDQDVERMLKLSPLLKSCGCELYLTLDGNEQYKSVEDLRRFWRNVTTDPATQWLAEHIGFIEQPFHRELALKEEVREEFEQWENRPPIIIDESDSELSSYPIALARGYDGTSHKNCKGIFKGLANRCLTIQQKTQRLRKTLMSGEDLGNIGPVSLPQDIAAMAAFGIESVERNGHFYFPGLAMYSKELQEQILEAHPDLYYLGRNEWPEVFIRNGKISAETTNRSPFGLRFVPNLDKEFERLTS